MTSTTQDRRRMLRRRLGARIAVYTSEGPPTLFPGAGLLVLRAVVGVTFLAHGLDKLLDPSGAERFFASLGIPAPGLMAPLVAVTETVGVVLLIAGLLTPLVGAALAIDMLVALLTAHIGNGFFVADGGIELTLLLGGASLGLALAGAGRFSLDALPGVAGGVARVGIMRVAHGDHRSPSVGPSGSPE